MLVNDVYLISSSEKLMVEMRPCEAAALDLQSVKSKVFFIIILWWTIGHWRLLVLLFVIYSRSGFGDDWILQVNLQDTAMILCGPVRPGLCCRSDRRVMRGQTGVARGLTGQHCVGFGFGLFIWISEFISWLLLLDGYYTYVILLFATNESSLG